MRNRIFPENDPFAPLSPAHAPDLCAKDLQRHQAHIRQRALRTADMAEFLGLPRDTTEPVIIQEKRRRRAAGDYACDNAFAAGGL